MITLKPILARNERQERAGAGQYEAELRSAGQQRRLSPHDSPVKRNRPAHRLGKRGENHALGSEGLERYLPAELNDARREVVVNLAEVRVPKAGLNPGGCPVVKCVEGFQPQLEPTPASFAEHEVLEE